jgi:ABC-type transporter Mla subunit MlaD
MIGGLGEGVMGRGSQLNEAIHVGPPSGANFDTTAYAILGRGGAAGDFLPFTNSGMAALNASRDQIADTFSPGATTAQAFVDQRGPIDHLLSFSAGWTRDVANLNAPQAPVFASLRRLALVADRVLPSVPQALRSATALLRDTPSALRTTKQVLNEVPRAVPAALHILFALQPDLTPLRAAFTDLVDPVSVLAEHGCDIQNAASGIRSLVNWGAQPGGHWGPDVGFPVGFIAGPQQGGFIADSGIRFPQELAYEPPCAYSPGVTMTPQTLMGIMDGSFK